MRSKLKKILKYWAFLGSIHDGVKVVKSNGSTGYRAPLANFFWGGGGGKKCDPLKAEWWAAVNVIYIFILFKILRSIWTLFSGLSLLFVDWKIDDCVVSSMLKLVAVKIRALRRIPFYALDVKYFHGGYVRSNFRSVSSSKKIHS